MGQPQRVAVLILAALVFLCSCAPSTPSIVGSWGIVVEGGPRITTSFLPDGSFSSESTSDRGFTIHRKGRYTFKDRKLQTVTTESWTTTATGVRREAPADQSQTVTLNIDPGGSIATLEGSGQDRLITWHRIR